jgi:dTMP kinase
MASDDRPVTPRFITLEGGEGVGKSTQISRLSEAFKDAGIDHIVTREPGGSAGAEAIRNLLMEGSDDRWNARAEALLFAAARADHVAKTILPALARGAWVICDRYVDSSRAYQGGGGGLTDGDVLALHRVGSDGLLPDRTFLLTLSAEKAAERLAVRDADGSDRMGSKSSEYQARLNQRFMDMAAEDPARWLVIDADGQPETITQRIWQELAPWLA